MQVEPHPGCRLNRAWFQLLMGSKGCWWCWLNPPGLIELGLSAFSSSYYHLLNRFQTLPSIVAFNMRPRVGPLSNVAFNCCIQHAPLHQGVFEILLRGFRRRIAVYGGAVQVGPG